MLMNLSMNLLTLRSRQVPPIQSSVLQPFVSHSRVQCSTLQVVDDSVHYCMMLPLVCVQALKLRLVATAGTTSGQMLNLITNDTQKLVDALTYFHYGKSLGLILVTLD